MDFKLVFLRIIVVAGVLLYAVPPDTCHAQRNATRKFEKETFGKTRKGAVSADRTKARGGAARAMKEQEKKEARRDREDEKALRELRRQHYEIQSEATRARMDNNSRLTEERYKAKKLKTKKEQQKPELQKPVQPKPPKDKKRVKTKDPKKQPRMKQYKVKKY